MHLIRLTLHLDSLPRLSIAAKKYRSFGKYVRKLKIAPSKCLPGADGQFLKDLVGLQSLQIKLRAEVTDRYFIVVVNVLQTVQKLRYALHPRNLLKFPRSLPHASFTPRKLTIHHKPLSQLHSKALSFALTRPNLVGTITTMVLGAETYVPTLAPLILPAHSRTLKHLRVSCDKELWAALPSLTVLETLCIDAYAVHSTTKIHLTRLLSF
jgi:hypothetical protein